MRSTRHENSLHAPSPMLWIKAFHIIFVVTWFAGLFYLPRLFVYHTLAADAISIERFKVMERKLFYGIMTPSAVLALASGLMLVAGQGMWREGWMQAKFALVLALIAHHVYLGKLMIDFIHDRNRHGHLFYRWLNEIPAAPVLLGAVILVVVKPF